MSVPRGNVNNIGGAPVMYVSSLPDDPPKKVSYTGVSNILTPEIPKIYKFYQLLGSRILY